MYTPLNLAKTNQFTLVRHGWFSPWYELTDGQYTYGKLSYHGFFWRKAIAETADETWIFEPDGIFLRGIKISTIEHKTVGHLQAKAFSKGLLILNNGFEATLSKPSIWNQIFTWATLNSGEVMQMKQKAFSNSIITITIDVNMLKFDTTPLLCFLGAHFIILKRRSKAAAH